MEMSNTCTQTRPEAVVRALIIVNAWSKHHGGLLIPQGYYGNVFAFPAAISKAGILCENPLGYAVELVKKVKEGMNENHIRSVTDFMEIRGRPPYNAGQWDMIVSDNKNCQLENVNVGWGLPLYGGVASTFNGVSVHLKHKKNGEDGILVLMSLPFLALKRFQEEVVKVIDEHKPVIKIPSTL